MNKHTKKTLVVATAAALLGAAGVARAITGGTGLVYSDEVTTGMVYLNMPTTDCTGTLLSPTWVLTAEHCVVPKSAAFGGTLDLPPKVATDLMRAKAVLWEPTNGRFILAGVREAPSATGGVGNRQLALAGVTPTGTFDGGFGSGGWTTPTIAGADAADVSDIALDGGRVLVAGAAHVGGRSTVLLASFSLSGALNGLPWAPRAGAPLFGKAHAIAPGGGGVYVAGRADDAGPRWLAAHFRSDGTLDPAFTPFFAGQQGELRDVVVMGSQVVWLAELGTGEPLLAVTDLTGAATGPQFRALPAALARASKLVVDAGGGLIVVGRDETQPGLGTELRLARLQGPALDLDPHFGNAGTASVSLVVESEDTMDVSGAEVDSQGRLVVAVARVSEGAIRMALARFDGSGHLDPTFAQGGLAATYGEDDPVIEALAIGPGDTVMVVGGKLDKPKMSATLFDDGPAAYQGAIVSYGSKTSPLAHTASVARVVHNQTFGLDVALVELQTPLGTGAHESIPFAGVNRIMPELLSKQQGRCLGYGVSEGDAVGLLRTADLTIDLQDSSTREIVMVSPTAVIEHGDSGGACFLPDSGLLLGVTRATSKNTGQKSFYPASERHSYTRPEFWSAWAHTTTGVDIER